MAVVETAMGIVLTELLLIVKEVMKEAKRYESVLKSMESTLESMIPIVEEIRMLNEVLACGDQDTEKLWEQIKKGKELVRKCKESKPCCCFFKKARCVIELEALDKSLKSFLDIVLKAQQLRVHRRILVAEEEIHEDVRTTLEVQVDTRSTVEGTSAEVKETLQEMKDLNDQFIGLGVVVQDNSEGLNKIDDELTNVKQEVDDILQRVKIIQDGHMPPNQYGKDGAVTNNNTSLNPCIPPMPPEHTFGLDKPLKDLKEKLLQGGMSVIAVSGPGGCGKTTLAKKLCHEEEIKGKFQDNIFFVTVSKTPNLKVIIQQLFLHNRYKVPEFKTDEEAINQLGQLMNEIGRKPILLVLDDVWSGSDSFVDMFKFQIADYKILVTSRSSFPRFNYTCKLEPLNDQDSMGLFRHSACVEDGSISIDEDVVNQAVKACKGFSLALTVVGRSLCRQPPEIWQKRVTEWSKGGIFNSNVDLLNHLTSSLDVLNNELKESYLDLGSFPEGHWIPATALVDMWAELYTLDENDRNSIANLHELSNLNLVNLRKDAGDAEGYYDEHFVMQHSLLRELVNHLSGVGPVEKRKRIILDITGNDFPEWGERDQPLSAHLLSISTDEKFSSNWWIMQAPKVKTLILNFRSEIYNLPIFLVNMKEVRALIITKYGFSPAEIRDPWLVGRLPNLRRIRLEQVLIPSLNLTPVPLEKLQKISLIRCTVGPDFGNSVQISNKYPNLVEINIGNCTDLKELPVGICGISKLKKLSITYCDSLRMLPIEIGKLEILEVLRLRFCTNLSELPYTIGDLQKLSSLDISYCISIRKLPEQIRGLQNLKKLYMTGCLNSKLSEAKFTSDIVQGDV